MKSEIYLLNIFSFRSMALIIYSLSTLHASSGGLTLPESDDGIAGSINNVLPLPYTPAELAMPPAGEIRKSYLRIVNELRTVLTARLAALPSGGDGQGSPWFGKFVAYKNGLDTVASSRLQADCFALVPQMAELLKAREGEDVPGLVSKNVGLVMDFSTVLISAIERHIIDQDAVVAPEKLTDFIKVFSTSGFQSEGEWEDAPISVDAAGILILDAAAVVTRLKSQPWQEAERFLGGATGAQALARYTASGDGMVALKTKYAANQATILAKWDELATWVAQQRGTP